jgi:Protein of unknown function (DUF2905)
VSLRKQLWLNTRGRGQRLFGHAFYHGFVGRTLIVIGLVLVALGIFVTFGERLPIKLGRLPGDIVFRGKNTTFYFPVVTSLLLSALLSLAIWLFNRR